MNIKYGPVLTYKDIEEAKKLIGKKVLASDYLSNIENIKGIGLSTLKFIDDTDIAPFYTYELPENVQFIREVIEDEPQYRPYTYDEAKLFVGYVVRVKSDNLPFGVKEQTKLITSVTKETNGVQIMGVSAEIFLKKYEWLDGKPCGVGVKE